MSSGQVKSSKVTLFFNFRALAQGRCVAVSLGREGKKKKKKKTNEEERGGKEEEGRKKKKGRKEEKKGRKRKGRKRKEKEEKRRGRKKKKEGRKKKGRKRKGRRKGKGKREKGQIRQSRHNLLTLPTDLLQTFLEPSNPQTSFFSFLFLFFSGFWELLGDGEGKLSRFGRGEKGTGVSKSFRFDLVLLTGQLGAQERR